MVSTVVMFQAEVCAGIQQSHLLIPPEVSPPLISASFASVLQEWQLIDGATAADPSTVSATRNLWNVRTRLRRRR